MMEASISESILAYLRQRGMLDEQATNILEPPDYSYIRTSTVDFDKLFLLWQALEKRVSALEKERQPGQRFLQKKQKPQ